MAQARVSLVGSPLLKTEGSGRIIQKKWDVSHRKSFIPLQFSIRGTKLTALPANPELNLGRRLEERS